MSDAVCTCGHDRDAHLHTGRCCLDVSRVGESESIQCPCYYFIESKPEHNPVTKPAHYSWIPGIECKDVVQHFNYYAGCAIKYLWRYQHKGNPIEDLKKSREYIDNEIARLEKERNK